MDQQHAAHEPSEAEIEEERERRLADENRPDGAEIDNTGRDFDPEHGMFEDSDDYGATPAPYPPLEEQET